MPTNGHMSPNQVKQSEPGWQERAVAGLEGGCYDDVAGKGKKVSVHSSWKWWALVGLAARQRGMSTQAYVRRCVSSFLVRDINMTWEEATSLCPAVSPRGRDSAEAREISRRKHDGKKFGTGRVERMDDGKGYGDWG